MPLDIESRIFTINNIYEMAKDRGNNRRTNKNGKILAGNYEIFNNIVKFYKID